MNNKAIKNVFWPNDIKDAVPNIGLIYGSSG